MKKDISKQFIQRIKEDKNKNTPHETPFNSMGITEWTNSIFWRPNNYRRQITLEKPLNSGYKTTIANSYGVPVQNHTKLVFIKNFKPNITLQIGKDKVTAIWSQNIIGGEKEIFLIKANSYHEIETRIDMKKEEIRDLCDSALTTFLKKFKLKATGPMWIRHEDFIKGEDYIDSIPKEVIIHDTFFKKVYQEGIEAIGGRNIEPTARIKQYIKNRMVEDYSPKIIGHLEFFKSFLIASTGDLEKWCEDNIHSIQDVYKHEAIIYNLSEEKRYIITNYLFKKFGGTKWKKQ